MHYLKSVLTEAPNIKSVLTVSPNCDTWSLQRTRRLAGRSCPEYAVLTSSGRSIIVASQKPFKFTYDSVNPVKQPEPEPEPKEDSGDGNGENNFHSPNSSKMLKGTYTKK